MNLPRLFLFAILVSQAALPAQLAISTYLRDGFTPSAIASDPQGNVYIAGSASGSALQTAAAAVAKINPQATEYVYVAYLDAAANDYISALAVDPAGNAYVTGFTTNPNFPVTGSSLGTPPTGLEDQRAFITKLSPQGNVVFSTLLGGSTPSTPRGIAVTPEGKILVSGLALSTGFPTTPGAYTVPDSASQWFLLELDASASRMIFSATGIGGSSLVLDTIGNIYMAGSSIGTSYPTTPGAYQTALTQGYVCYGFCRIGFPGNLQHVTKTDSAATKLIYSTGINDPSGAAGSTTNTGLAVDAAGNAYVTGTLDQAKYPFTETASSWSTSFLTKLDPAGAAVLYSVPIGGGGVQLDPNGSLVLAGTVVKMPPIIPFPGADIPLVPPPAFSTLPSPCLPNSFSSTSAAYFMKVDPATGAVQDSQWLDTAAAGAVGITLAGGKTWLTGQTAGPQVPITPGALTQPTSPGLRYGAYLSAVDFATPAPAGPSLACVLDAANLSHTGVIAPYQLLSLFGSNLGPETPAQASGYSGTSPFAGVSVTFNGIPAPLLYVSSSQLNVVVPAPVLSPSGIPLETSTVMELTYNGVSVQRQFPLTTSNLNLFANLSTRDNPCQTSATMDLGFQPLATNADGSPNSCTNPAKPGATVSLYGHGAGGLSSPFPQLQNIHASLGYGCTALVTNASLTNDFLYKLDVSIPEALTSCVGDALGVQGIPVTLNYNDMPVGPFSLPVNVTSSGDPIRMIVWVQR